MLRAHIRLHPIASDLRLLTQTVGIANVKTGGHVPLLPTDIHRAEIQDTCVMRIVAKSGELVEADIATIEADIASARTAIRSTLGASFVSSVVPPGTSPTRVLWVHQARRQARSSVSSAAGLDIRRTRVERIADLTLIKL